jgi:hypothetical protein
MMPRHADRPCPGRNLPCVIVGAVVGLGLAGVAVTWLWVANRELWLEQFAVDRNLSAAALMGVVMLVPVLAFVKYPLRIFFSGIVAWTVLTMTYSVMTMRFADLESRLSSFHLFMLGAIAYVLAAVFVWLLHMALLARQQPLAPTRHRRRHTDVDVTYTR